MSQPTQMRDCRSCGATLTKKPGPGRWPAFCSERCRSVGKRDEMRARYESSPKHLRLITRRGPDAHGDGACENCGGPCRIETGGRRVRFCNGPLCVVVANRIRAREKPRPRRLYARVCPFCGTAFTAHHGNRTFCSTVCSRRSYSTMRRARKANAAVFPIRLAVIMSLSCGVCYLCREELDPTSVSPEAASTVLDHVVPLARGGEHSEANLRPTHWYCNSLKADLTVDEFRARYPNVREMVILRLAA